MKKLLLTAALAALTLTATAANAATWVEVGDSGLYMDVESIQGKGTSYVRMNLWNTADDENFRFPMGIDCAGMTHYLYFTNGDTMVEKTEPRTPAAMLTAALCDPALVDMAAIIGRD